MSRLDPQIKAEVVGASVGMPEQKEGTVRLIVEMRFVDWEYLGRPISFNGDGGEMFVLRRDDYINLCQRAQRRDPS